MELETKTIADIRAQAPYIDPVTGCNFDGKKINEGYLPEDWTGTALDILKIEALPAKERLWIAAHWLDARTALRCMAYCARRAQVMAKHPDPRSVEALCVLERFAVGEEASMDEWRAAYRLSKDAAWETKGAFAWAVAYAIAGPTIYAAVADVAYYAAKAIPTYSGRLAEYENQVRHLAEVLAH